MSARNPLIVVLQRNLRRALRERRIEEYEDILTRLREEDPLSVETRGLELECLVSARSQEAAAKLADQLVTLFPDSARIQYLAGRAAYLAKQYPLAATRFTESQGLHPSWLTRQWLGKTHTQSGAFDKAEALLLPLLEDHPWVARDLAWLYERMDRPQEALRYLDQFLKAYPDDELARTQQLRLSSRVLSPAELVDEVETLEALDETVPPQVFATYIERLLETGQGGQARQIVEQRLANLDIPTTRQLAWNCYRRQAFDLALSLFLRALPEYSRDFKYLNALEKCARQCQQVDLVIQHYEQLADQDKRFHGRIRSLRAVMG